MNQLGFYFRYAFRNVVRGGRWTTLAIFCIAAGVATVVALRGLGLAIGETLQRDVRMENKGDVRLVKDSRGPGGQALLLGGEELDFFSEAEIQAVTNYVEDELGGGTISGYTIGGNLSIASEGDNGNVLLSQFITTFLIDPQSYPPTHTIELLEPEGLALADAFIGENDIIISENLAQQQGLAVGDLVRISRSDELFTVRGIVDTNVETTIRNPLNGFFGFAYVDLQRIQEVIDPELGINNLVIALDTPLTEENHEDVARQLERLASTDVDNTFFDTALDLLERNEAISQVLGDFIVVMGLGALLIGGVGIMNTMLVLVRRRTNEIAAMKTFGMKGKQVAALFLAEGILLGIIGSVIGSILGILLGGFVNQFGEQFIQQELTWRIHPEALLYGFVLGMLITIIFGLVPIMTTLQIRPGIILRPNEAHMPRLGILQSGALMLLITLAIGLIVGQIISPTFGLSSTFTVVDPFLWGVVGVAATLALLGILTGLFWLVVLIVGKLPAFGNVDLRLALRNLSTHRLRTATTLLALSAGMFALSSITFVGEGTRQLLNVQLSSTFGGNVLAIPISVARVEALEEFTRRNLSRALEDVPGVLFSTTLSNYQMDLVAIDGVPFDGGTIDPEEFEGFDQAQTASFTWRAFSSWDSDNPNIYDEVLNVARGRNLTAEDEGQQLIVGPLDSARTLGIDVGSVVTYEVGGDRMDYTVVGLAEATSGAFGGSVTVPMNATGRKRPDFQIFSFMVAPEYVNQAVAELSAVRVPATIALDVAFVDSLLSRLIDQFAALPTIVGLLSLFAAAVIMANTVALSTLERRRQIGILKSIGLKSWRVLVIMLIETTIIGLLSALLGIGLSALFVVVFGRLSGTLIPLPTDARITSLLLVIAAILIAWVATFLSANVAVRERVMNVLRYE